jgi:hypothetical protein
VLDAITVREVLGRGPKPEAVLAIRREVAKAVAIVEASIVIDVAPARLVVQGRPLADWLLLDEIARLLRLWGSRERLPL